jgi:predicted enzyme related to lactoylglutathione lyase
MAVATSTSVLGRPLWFELLTSNIKAAEQFYSAVVGWTITPFRSGEEPYDMWTRTGNASVGGVMAIPQGMNVPPHWVMYIGAPRLEEAVAHVERLGGSAMSPVIKVPDVGQMRIMHDPQGAMFAIFEPAPSSGSANSPEVRPELGDTSWRELQTNDAAAAMKFYVDLFGWRETQAMDMGPMGKYHIFARQWDLGGIMNKPPQMANLAPHWGLYFRVADVASAAERVKANGGQVLNGPMEVPGGDLIINCVDPQGATFSLHQQKVG